MKTKILIVSVIVLTASFPLHAGDVNVRSGIANTFKLFDKLEYQQVAFFGGDVLRGKEPYSKAAHTFFREHFKDSNIGYCPYPDQGGSWYGAFRVARAEPVYGATVHSACIAFIDFCSSDKNVTEKQFGRYSGEQAAIDAYEGIVRGLFSFRNTLDVVFVYTLSPEMLDDFKAGKTPPIIEWAEKVAAFYDIPSVNLAKDAADKINSGVITAQEFFAEGIIPTPQGEAIYAEKMKAFLAACLEARTTEDGLVSRQLAEPISPTNMQYAQIIAYEWGDYPNTWQDGQTSPDPYLRHTLNAKSSGEYSLTFKGKRIGMIGTLPGGDGEGVFTLPQYSLDGVDWKTVSHRSLRKGQKTNIWLADIAEGLDPDKEHILKLRDPSGTALIGAFLVDGSVQRPFEGLAPLERLDAIYVSIPPIDYTPPQGRWTRIPQTMEKLQNGPSLKIVMLGDSIMGDTGSSQYERLLEREYPNCKVQRIMSLRGSTGCWWYKDENRVEDYVLKHEPDLLMIGGISQRGDVEAIRSVIHQVRAKQNPEIMLITPVFGHTNDPHIRNWTYEIDAEKYAYRAELKQLAEEENCEFVDLTGEWWKYIQNSGKTYGWFMRDAVHANDRGFQILGRLLVRYLTD